MASQQRYRAVVCDAASKMYGETSYATIKDITDELNGTGSCTVEVPINDPEIGIFQPITREIAVMRDGLSYPFWRGPIVRPSTDTNAPSKVGFQCQNPLWYFSHRFFGSPEFPTNWLLNGSFEQWTLTSVPDFWTNNDAAHTTLTHLTLQANPGLVLLGNSSVELTNTTNGDEFIWQSVPGSGSATGTPGAYPTNSEGYAWTLSGWFYIVPTMTAGPYGGRGLFMQFLDSSGTIVESTGGQPGVYFTITPNTPSGIWLPASTGQLVQPGTTTTSGVGTPWQVHCRCYAGVGGSIIWDAVQLTVEESLSPAQPGGSDQSDILRNIVLYAQGQSPTGGSVGFAVDNTKSNLHITTLAPATGYKRADLVYFYADRRGILDSLNDYPGFYPENDFAIIDTSPTSRQFETYGRAVTDGVTTQGANSFSSASAAFNISDAYQPLWNQNIPGGALILPAGLTSTAITFSGPPATGSGSSQHVFIGGRRGIYRPSVPLFRDGTSTNLSSVSTWDQDGEQMANSVVATGTTTGVAQYFGAALKGTQLGTLTSALTAGTPYTSLAVTAIAAAVATGDWLRVGAYQWQPGVEANGFASEAVVASAPAAIGATSISINSFTPFFSYGTGRPVVDFTPTVTMEDVLTSVDPAPIGSLTQQAQSEMLSRQSAVEILTVTTENNFIDNWCGGTPLSCGDVLVVSIQSGNYLNIVNTPYRIISWTLNPDTDAYTLQLNLVAM